MQTVKAYPSLLSAITRNNLVAPARVYKLLQAIDDDRRGLFLVEDARKKLCNRHSKYYVCSWRWMRELLDRGEGIFWQRHTKDQLWLNGPKRVALALNVERLQGRPVYLPVDALLGSIKEVSANFFAAYESGRKHDNPISQRTLRQVTGVSERAQYEYNKLLGRKATKNYTITNLEYNQENVYKLVVQAGRPVMRFIDWHGLQGESRKAVCLYRLPDTRSRVHEQAAKGRQGQINKAINLAITREQGNDSEVNRLYFPTIGAAVKDFGRNPEQPHYWPLGKSVIPNAGMTGKFEGVNMWGGLVH